MKNVIYQIERTHIDMRNGIRYIKSTARIDEVSMDYNKMEEKAKHLRDCIYLAMAKDERYSKYLVLSEDVDNGDTFQVRVWNAEMQDTKELVEYRVIHLTLV